VPILAVGTSRKSAYTRLYNSRGVLNRNFIVWIALLLPWSFSAAAHPHTWIDYSVTVVFDSGGRIEGLKQNWLFDDYYSAYVGTEIPRSGGQFTQPGLDAWVKRSLGNLKEYQYFTEVQVNGMKIAFSPPSQTGARVTGKRLNMAFYLPFAKPVDAKGAKINYRIFDPFYYIEMLHADSRDAIRMQGAPKGCRHIVIPPNPDPQIVMRAYSLDASQKGTPDLGRHFAQSVTISC